MTPEDRARAREALERGQLTVEQVEEIRAESDRSGRPFLEVAGARGLLKPSPAPPPPPPAIASAPAKPKKPPAPRIFFALLAASALIFTGLLIATLLEIRERSRREDDLALESAKMRDDADRKAGQARFAYERKIVEAREAQARAALEKARGAMSGVEDRMRGGAKPADLELPLSEAAAGFNAYLEIHPEDAPVHVERARARELRRNFDKAVEDLERAIEIDPKLQPELQDRLWQLRLKAPKK